MPLCREAGKRASEASASTSVNASWFPRVSAGVLCRVTDVAASHLLVDAYAREQRMRERFPGMRLAAPKRRARRRELEAERPIYPRPPALAEGRQAANVTPHVTIAMMSDLCDWFLINS
jgi:hypothetical protein